MDLSIYKPFHPFWWSENFEENEISILWSERKSDALWENALNNAWKSMTHREMSFYKIFYWEKKNTVTSVNGYSTNLKYSVSLLLKYIYCKIYEQRNFKCCIHQLSAPIKHHLFLMICTSHRSNNSKSSMHEKVAPSITVSSWNPCSQFGNSRTSIRIGILFCHKTSCTCTKSLVLRHYQRKKNQRTVLYEALMQNCWFSLTVPLPPLF